MATIPLLRLTLLSGQFYNHASGHTDPNDLVTVSPATNEGGVIMHEREEVSPQDGLTIRPRSDTISLSQITDMFNSSVPAVQLY